MPKLKSERESQLDQFKKIAREQGVNEDEAAFDQKLAQIAKAKPTSKNDSK